MNHKNMVVGTNGRLKFTKRKFEYRKLTTSQKAKLSKKKL